MRRANGTGYISKASDNRRKKWQVYAPTEYILTGELDKNGLPKSKSVRKLIGSFETREEAELELAKFNTPKDKLEDFNKNHKKFGEVCEEYLHRLEIENAPYNTIIQKKIYYKKISENLRNKLIKDVRLPELQETIDAYPETWGVQKQLKSFISMVYKYAIPNEYCSINYADGIRIPKQKKKIKEKYIFTVEDIKKLWEMTNSVYYFDRLRSVQTLMLIYSGMRSNELLKLKKSDINLEKRIIIGGSKTEEGTNRIIPIHKDIVELYRKELQISHTDYLFVLRDNTDVVININTSTLNAWLKPKFGGISSHAARRTFLTAGFYQNCNFYILEKVVGHKTEAIGIEAYVQISPNRYIEEVDKIDFLKKNE